MLTYDEFAAECKRAGLDSCVCVPGHWQILRGKFLVNFYPHTKQGMRYYVNGASHAHSGNLASAIGAALNGAESTPVARMSDGRRKRIRRSLLNRHPFCAACGKKLTPETARLDHRVPISMGGTNGTDNLQLLCAEHDKAKGNSLTTNRAEPAAADDNSTAAGTATLKVYLWRYWTPPGEISPGTPHRFSGGWAIQTKSRVEIYPEAGGRFGPYGEEQLAECNGLEFLYASAAAAPHFEEALGRLIRENKTGRMSSVHSSLLTSNNDAAIISVLAGAVDPERPTCFVLKTLRDGLNLITLDNAVRYSTNKSDALDLRQLWEERNELEEKFQRETQSLARLAKQIDLLVEHFKEFDKEAGREGDRRNWNPAQTAVHFLSERREKIVELERAAKNREAANLLRVQGRNDLADAIEKK